MNDTKEFVEIGHDDLYSYLLVNIGYGVSIIKAIHVILITSSVVSIS